MIKVNLRYYIVLESKEFIKVFLDYDKMVIVWRDYFWWCRLIWVLKEVIEYFRYIDVYEFVSFEMERVFLMDFGVLILIWKLINIINKIFMLFFYISYVFGSCIISE